MINFFKKNILWVLTHFAFVIMAIMLIANPSNWKLLTPYSGFTAVGLLLLILSLNPLRFLFPKLSFLRKLNNYRQEIGIACFSYSLIHVACYIIKKGGFSKVLPYLLHPAIIPGAFIAFPIFLILAITSNKYFLKKLGFVKWKKLHKSVYIAELAIFIHMMLIDQKFYAILLFTPIVILQIIKKRSAKSLVTN